jgi:hypothetical protein
MKVLYNWARKTSASAITVNSKETSTQVITQTLQRLATIVEIKVKNQFHHCIGAWKRHVWECREEERVAATIKALAGAA